MKIWNYEISKTKKKKEEEKFWNRGTFWKKKLKLSKLENFLGRGTILFFQETIQVHFIESPNMFKKEISALNIRHENYNYGIHVTDNRFKASMRHVKISSNQLKVGGAYLSIILKC